MSKLSFSSRYWFALTIVVSLVFTLTIDADAQPIDKVIFPKTAQHLLISYSVQHDMLAQNDVTPLIRIYGDGRMRVHRPAYMKKSGDYEMKLSQPVLQALCRKFIDHQIMSFSEENAKNEIKDMQNASGHQYAISDSSSVEITFNPVAVRLARSSRVEPVGGRRHKVLNPRAQARFFSQSTYRHISALEDELISFLYADGLVRVP